MTSGSAVTTASPGVSRDRWSRAELLRRVDRWTAGVAVVVVAQAVWIAVLCAHGWFYQDDLTFLAQAVHRPLGWSYLSSPVNQHFTPGLRLQFWLMQRYAPFNVAVSIAVRILLQAATTVLLARLLELLVGRRPGVVALLACYAVNPLLVPGTLWFAAATNLLPAQLFAVLALTWHVRSTMTGRLRYAAGAGAALVLGAACWEKSATVAVVLPILSIAFLHEGGLAARVRAALALWCNWLLTLGPLFAFVVYFFLHGYGQGADVPPAHTLARLSWSTWWHSIAPSLAGGPWHWFSAPDVYESFSNPPLALEILAQVAVLVVVTAGIRRRGWASLWAWLLPVTTTVVGVVLVAAGRYATFGALIDRAYTYVFDTALTWTVAVALALMSTSPQQVAQRVGGTAPSPAGTGRPRTPLLRRGRPIGVGVVTTLVVASSVISACVYVGRWSENPSGRWFATLRRNVVAAGPSLNLWDTSAPSSVLRLISEKHHISDVLDVAGLTVRYNQTDTDPKIVDDNGRIRPAALLPVAHAVTTGPNSLCNDLITGTTVRTQRLVGSPSRNEWFVHLEYFQQRPTVVDVHLVDDRGRTITPVGGARTVLTGTLGAVNLQLPYAAPRVLRIRSDNAAANLCLTNAVVGYPFPKGRP